MIKPLFFACQNEDILLFIEEEIKRVVYKPWLELAMNHHVARKLQRKREEKWNLKRIKKIASVSKVLGGFKQSPGSSPLADRFESDTFTIQRTATEYQTHTISKVGTP